MATDLNWDPIPLDRLDLPTLAVSVRRGLSPDGERLVRFHRRSRASTQLDQVAAWRPGGGWNERRWYPIGARLVPPAAVQAVEQWLRGGGNG